MSDLPTHVARWRQHGQPRRPTSHWNGYVRHTGTVEDCPICKESTNDQK